MTTPQLSSESSISALPARWQNELSQQVAQGENVLSAFEVDLDHKLRFVKGLIVVTNQGIVSKAAGDSTWEKWTYRKDLQLTHHDHAGVGYLQLSDEQGLLAKWRFTLGQNLLAIRLLNQFTKQYKVTSLDCLSLRLSRIFAQAVKQCWRQMRRSARSVPKLSTRRRPLGHYFAYGVSPIRTVCNCLSVSR